MISIQDAIVSAAIERYTHILEQLVLGEVSDTEAHLADAYELGRSLVDQMVPPDEITHIHHDALSVIAKRHPGLTLAQAVDPTSRPLMEMSMAYGLFFRAQTERRYEAMLGARLEQSRKLEAVGTLAAGIAHDFNNLLGSIVGFAELAGDSLPEDTPGKRSIAQVLTASFRARDLISRLLAFARQSPVQAHAIDILVQIQEALALLQGSGRAKANICFETTLTQAIVLADPMQIQQIVMNLCINAADAMESCGTIDIHVDHAATFIDPPAGHGQGICLTVADTGSGMTPEILERVFDPFFSTKAPHKGMGLGLSVVYGIVTQLGGAIEVQSHTTGTRTGTRFRIFLPVVNQNDGTVTRIEDTPGKETSNGTYSID